MTKEDITKEVDKFVKWIHNEIDWQELRSRGSTAIIGNLPQQLYWSSLGVGDAVYDLYIDLGIKLSIQYAGAYILSMELV